MDDSSIISRKKGNGRIKLEVWKYDDGSYDYSFAYINHRICCKDNGRVLGYDKKRKEGSHGEPHKHYMGKRIECNELPMAQVIDIFQNEWEKIHNENRN